MGVGARHMKHTSPQSITLYFDSQKTGSRPNEHSSGRGGEYITGPLSLEPL